VPPRPLSLTATDLLQTVGQAPRKAKKAKKRNKQEETRPQGELQRVPPSTHDAGDRRKARDAPALKGPASKGSDGNGEPGRADNAPPANDATRLAAGKDAEQVQPKVVNLADGDGGDTVTSLRTAKSHKIFPDRSHRVHRSYVDLSTRESNAKNFFEVTTPVDIHRRGMPVANGVPGTFDLSALWEAYKEPSVFGCEVPFVDAQKCPQYYTYVPYLSAMQLFRDVEKGQPEQVFEYFETAPPHKRKCLHPMIQCLVEKHPQVSRWLLGPNQQLSRASWLSILWVSVPRDVQQPNTSLLLYHKLALSVNSRLERFGVVSYRADAQLWPTVASADPPPSTADHSMQGQMQHQHHLLMQWMQQQSISHPDFEFFRTRCDR